MAGVILEARLQVKIAQRDPACFAAPAHMDDFLPIGQQCSERGDGARRGCVGEREELILAGGDTNGAHRPSLAHLVRTMLMSKRCNPNLPRKPQWRSSSGGCRRPNSTFISRGRSNLSWHSSWRQSMQFGCRMPP